MEKREPSFPVFPVKSPFFPRKEKRNIVFGFIKKFVSNLFGAAPASAAPGKGSPKKDQGKKRGAPSTREGKRKQDFSTDKGPNPPRKKEKKPQSAAPQKVPRKVKEPMPELVPPPEAEGKVSFFSLDLAPEIKAAAQTLNFQYCTPIQEQSLPHAIAGKDLAAKAQTGTGKTAAFLASSMSYCLKNPLPPEKRKEGSCRVLVLSPTRELAIQIKNDADGLARYTDLNNLVIFGGMDHQGQREALSTPVDILVGTPGRIIDYSRSGHLNLRNTEILVIDEADRMLDMGFIPDVRRIVSQLPPAGMRQTMLFSATLEPEVLRLVDSWLIDPVSLEAEPDQIITDLIEQKFYAVTSDQKLPFLLNFLKNTDFERVIIFGNWKEKNRILADRLYEYGIEAGVLSGDIPQEKFKKGTIKVVVATDVAARGLHVEGISHVVNYDLPDHPEDYIHRIGRTGRAGKSGTAIGFVCEYGAYVMPDIEEYAKMTIHTELPEDSMLVMPEAVNPKRFTPRPASSQRSGGRSGSYSSSRRPSSGTRHFGGKRR